MAKQIQLRRGTTTENNGFTGALGELTYDTEKKQLRVHDGITVGGKSILDPTDTTNAVTQATETTAGKAKIATTEIAQAGVNDTDIMTPKKVKDQTFGAGQQNKARDIVIGTSYTHTEFKPIYLMVIVSASSSKPVLVTLNNLTLFDSTVTGQRFRVDFFVSHGDVYTVQGHSVTCVEFS